MKLEIERLLLVIVAFLVFTAALSTEVTFSSDGDLELENEHCLQPDERENTKTTVTVFHRDEFGNELLPACIISIATPGTLYIATNENEALPEYDWLRTVGHAVGFHQVVDTEVIFIYRRRPHVSITPHQHRAQPGDVIHYTVIITNDAAGVIEDAYTLRVHFDLRFSSVFRLEFMLDYLEVGDTVIEFSMPVIQSSLAGVKNVKAMLIHPPGMMGIDDTEVLTQVTVNHPEAQRPSPPPPPSTHPPSGSTPSPPTPPPNGSTPSPSTPPPSGSTPSPSTPPPSGSAPGSSTPPPSGPVPEATTPPQASVPSPDGSEPSTGYDEDVYEDEAYEEDTYDDESEADNDHDHVEDEPTDDGDDYFNRDDDDLIEDVDPKEEEETEPTLSMMGTLVYDVFILGAIIGVNVKNWHKLTVIRF